MTTQSVCEIPGCREPAIYHFGVEAPEGRKAFLAHAQGELIAGRWRFPGDTIHVCQPHAKTHVYDHVRREEKIRLLEGRFDV